MTKDYFQKLNQTLKDSDRALPSLIIDLDKLDRNLSTLKSNLNPKASYRIVVKSLPSWELIEYVMKSTATQKLMVFHQPFLTELSSRLTGNADILMGKPIPIKTATYFYKNLISNKNFDAFKQIQWLVIQEKELKSI